MVFHSYMKLKPERFRLSRKRCGTSFCQDPGRGDNDTRHRLPTRQMGWLTLGCNQQDPWNASERLVNRKPACMVPDAPGERTANTV